MMTLAFIIRRALLLACLVFPLHTVLAQQSNDRDSGDRVQLRADHPERHTVVRGDTLWDISARFLDNPLLWPRVWRVNPQIDNPDLIYPGDVVALRYIDGEPVLMLERGMDGGRSDLPAITLTPRLRREPLSGGLGDIAMAEIRSRLSENRIVDEASLADAAYVVGTESGALLAGAGDIIYARGDWSDGLGRYDIMRPTRHYTVPGTKEKLGVELNRVGEVSVLREDDGLATLRVLSSRQEIRSGDKLLPGVAMDIRTHLSPAVPHISLRGHVLGFEDQLSVAGAGATVVLDLGSLQGLEEGHLLDIRHADRIIRDEVANEDLSLPGDVFGRVLVYRVFDRASLGLILESSGPVSRDDRVGAN